MTSQLSPRRLIVFLLLAVAGNATAQTDFRGLGFLSSNPDNAYSTAAALSGDGLTVVGNSIDDHGDFRSFRWTAAGGMIALPVINPEWYGEGYGYGEAHGVSHDGSVIVGEDYNLGDLPGSTIQGYRWTAGGTPSHPGTTTGLPYVDVDYVFGQAFAVSADGSTVVGTDGGNSRASRWTAAGGMQIIGNDSSAATGVSADGSVVAGWEADQAFRWTEAGGMEYFGVPGASSTEATALSADGSTVVGNFDYSRAFAWTEGGGLRLLDMLPDSTEWAEHHAHAVSADGRWAVGHGGESYAEIAALWDTTTGEVWDLNVLFGSASGFEGWILQFANGISADGLTLAGWGLNPDGIGEAWIGTLSAHPAAVPEPATCAALAGLGALALAIIRRRSQTTV